MERFQSKQVVTNLNDSDDDTIDIVSNTTINRLDCLKLHVPNVTG